MLHCTLVAQLIETKDSSVIGTTKKLENRKKEREVGVGMRKVPVLWSWNLSWKHRPEDWFRNHCWSIKKTIDQRINCDGVREL